MGQAQPFKVAFVVNLYFNIMITRSILRPLLFLLFFTVNQSFAQTKWTPYLASVSFKIKNAWLTVDGSLKGFKGDLEFSDDALNTSLLEASVQVATINTGNGKRDSHLRSADYFDADRYKTIEIKSKKLYKTSNGYAGIFNVTIKNITHEVEIPFHYIVNGNNATFEGSFAINRLDYGVGGNSLIMGDNVTISIVVNTKK
jgi:polyisoprenoid-binding protein YceI